MRELIDNAVADMEVAYDILNNSFSNPSKVCIAAYLSQQSIEKTLKHILYIETHSYPRTHDITMLARRVLAIGINIPNEITLISGIVTDWEASARYDTSVDIPLNQIKMALDINKEFIAYVNQLYSR